MTTYNNKKYLIIPVFNEEKNLKSLLINLLKYKNNLIFINDGSTDNTEYLIKEKGYKVISNESNIGISKSIAKGVNYAYDNNYKNIILMDGDGQHKIEFLDLFINSLDNYDFVFGNRFHKETIAPDIKWNINILAALIINDLYNIKLTDTSCGFKAFRLTKETLQLFEESSNYEIIYRILIYALKNNKNIKLINIDAIYYYKEFLFSRRIEILSFIDSIIDSFSEIPLINEELLNFFPMFVKKTILN